MKPRQKAHAWKIPAQDIFISLSPITSERVLNMGKCGYRERFIVFRIFTYQKYTRQRTYAHRPHTHYLFNSVWVPLFLLLWSVNNDKTAKSLVIRNGTARRVLTVSLHCVAFRGREEDNKVKIWRRQNTPEDKHVQQVEKKMSENCHQSLVWSP